MQNIEEFYITGLPIGTVIGECHFLTVSDYTEYFSHLEALSLTKEKIIFLRANNGESKEVLDELQKLDIVELILIHGDIKEMYTELLAKVFQDEEAFYKIETLEQFLEIRNLIMRMNCVKEEKINPNPEIQKWIEKSKKFKQQEGQKLTFADIVSSIATGTSHTYKDINEMTIYQMYMTFYRINNFKNFDTSTLFATVSSEKIKIESWSSHIDLYEEEQHGISRDEFNEKSNSLFGSS